MVSQYTDPNAPIRQAGGPPAAGQIPGQDLDQTDQQPQAAPSSGGIGQVVSNLGDQWNQFIDHPEHRAGLMQFAVNMLSGRGLGESIGAAAEATGRNVASQEERERAETEAERKQQETEAYTTIAEAKAAETKKGDPLDRQMTMLAARDALAARKAAFDNYNKWLGSEDVGMDPYMEYIKNKYKTITNKRQLIDPKTPEEKAAVNEMQQRFQRQGAGDFSSPQVGPNIPPKPKNVPGAVLMNVNGKPVWYDPRTKLPAQ